MKKEKDQNSMRVLFTKDVQLLNNTFQSMKSAIIAYCNENYDAMNANSEETIRIEKEQDRLRDVLFEKIFSKETMVFSRMDRLKMVKTMDTICDEAEIVVRKLMHHSPKPDSEIKSGLEFIAEKNSDIGNQLEKLIIAILEDFSKGKELIKIITDIRREVRDRHWLLLNHLYKNNPNPIDFFYFQNLVKTLAKIADRAEYFADDINSLLCKYAL